MLPNPDNDPRERAANVTEERAARRFHQIRHFEAGIAKLDKKIIDAKDKVASLKEEREGQLAQLLAAARDEGDLPLFADLDD